MAQGDVTFALYLINSNKGPDQLGSKLWAISRALGNPAAMSAFLQECAAVIGVKAEEFGIIYPIQPEPRQPEPKISAKTGKQFAPRKRKRYKRTGHLGGSLTSSPIEVGGGTWFALVGTNASYAPFVVGQPTDDPGQAWFHQGVWEPLADSIKAHLPELRAVLLQLMNDKLKSLGVKF